MTDAEFDAYLAAAAEELEAKQHYLVNEFGLGKHGHYFLDFEKGKIRFSEGDVTAVEASMIFVGSHVPEKNHWKWGWANPSIPEHVRSQSARIRQLGKITGLELFTNESVIVEPQMPGEFTALACKLLQAKGAYTIAHDEMNLYLLLDCFAPAPVA